MDRGTDALPMLRNQVFPLRLGYVAVVNRSQQDIQRRVRVAASRRAEERWFAAHPEYGDVEAQCGIHALAKRCALHVCCCALASEWGNVEAQRGINALMK